MNSNVANEYTYLRKCRLQYLIWKLIMSEISRRKKLCRTLFFLTLCAILMFAVLGSDLLFSNNTDVPNTIEVKRDTIERSISALGTLEPKDYVDVGVQVSGQVEHLNVDVGDQVSQGDLLAEIDATVFEASVDAERAALRRLEASLEERNAQMDLAQKRLQRETNLFANRATSRDNLDVAEADVKIMQAQVKGLQAQIDQTSSSLRANEANLGYTKIYAPMSGTVVSLDAKVGQTLNANQTTPIILRLADLGTMTVRAEVSEADVIHLYEGMEAYFTTLGDRSHKWEGKLKQILPTPEILNDVVLYQALFDVKNEGGKLLNNMTAHVFFVQDKKDDVLTLPLSALPPDQQDKQSINLMTNTQQEPKVTRVSLGLRDQVNVEVLNNLSDGDEVYFPVGNHNRGADKP